MQAIEALCPCENYVFECTLLYEKDSPYGYGAFEVRLKDPMDSMCPYCTFQVTPEFLDTAAEDWIEEFTSGPEESEDWLRTEKE